MNKSISARVRDGIALLGDRISEIDIEKLDVVDFVKCPLGQIFGSFWLGRQELDIRPDEYGFDPYVGEPRENPNIWEELNIEWKHQLRELLTPA